MKLEMGCIQLINASRSVTISVDVDYSLCLAISLQRAHPANLIKAHMGRKDNEQFPLVWHMMEIRAEAGLAGERQPTETTKGKSLLPTINH